MLGQVEGYLLDHIANANAAAEVRGRTQGIRVVYSKQVQIHVEKKTPGVFCINLKLLHGLNVTTLYIKQLIVNQPLQNFGV